MTECRATALLLQPIRLVESVVSQLRLLPNTSRIKNRHLARSRRCKIFASSNISPVNAYRSLNSEPVSAPLAQCSFCVNVSPLMTDIFADQLATDRIVEHQHPTWKRGAPKGLLLSRSSQVCDMRARRPWGLSCCSLFRFFLKCQLSTLTLQAWRWRRLGLCF